MPSSSLVNLYFSPKNYHLHDQEGKKIKVSTYQEAFFFKAIDQE
jgi:hypothetical protein